MPLHAPQVSQAAQRNEGACSELFLFSVGTNSPSLHTSSPRSARLVYHIALSEVLLMLR